MRTRRHRLMFDCLDARVVLDSGADLVSGGTLGSTVLAVTATQPTLTDTIDGTVTGTSTTSDPAQATVPLDLLAAS